MPLNDEQIQTKIVALETIISTASDGVLNISSVKQQIENKLQAVAAPADRVMILQHLLTQSASFQKFLDEKLAIATDIRETGLLEICAFLVVLYKKNIVTANINSSQTNNLREILEKSIAKKLRDGWISGEDSMGSSDWVRALCSAIVNLPAVPVNALALPIIVMGLILSPGIQAIQRTQNDYQAMCESYAKLLVYCILGNNGISLPDKLKISDLKLLKNIIWSTVLSLKDPAMRLHSFSDMLDNEKFSCRLMDINRFKIGLNSAYLTAYAIADTAFHRQFNRRLFSSTLSMAEKRTNRGTRKGILNYIKDAEDGCVAEFLREKKVSTGSFLWPLAQILQLSLLNRSIVELDNTLTEYESSKKMDDFRNGQIIRIREEIQNASQAFTNSSISPQNSLDSLMQLISKEQNIAQSEHHLKHAKIARLLKPNSQFSRDISDFRKGEMKKRLSRNWTTEVAYLFLQLANSLTKTSDPEVKLVDLFPLVLIMEISQFLTGLDQNQTKILWEQYCAFNPQSPAVQRLNGEGRWSPKIFSNVSTAPIENLLSTTQLISDENEQNKDSGHLLPDFTGLH